MQSLSTFISKYSVISRAQLYFAVTLLLYYSLSKNDIWDVTNKTESSQMAYFKNDQSAVIDKLSSSLVHYESRNISKAISCIKKVNAFTLQIHTKINNIAY